MKLEAEGEEGRAVAGGNKWLHLTLWLQPSFRLKNLRFTYYCSGQAEYWEVELLCHGMGIGVIITILEVFVSIGSDKTGIEQLIHYHYGRIEINHT